MLSRHRLRYMPFELQMHHRVVRFILVSIVQQHVNCYGGAVFHSGEYVECNDCISSLLRLSIYVHLLSQRAEQLK